MLKQWRMISCDKLMYNDAKDDMEKFESFKCFSKLLHIKIPTLKLKGQTWSEIIIKLK